MSTIKVALRARPLSSRYNKKDIEHQRHVFLINKNKKYHTVDSRLSEVIAAGFSSDNREPIDYPNVLTNQTLSERDMYLRARIFNYMRIRIIRLRIIESPLHCNDCLCFFYS